MLMSKRTKQKIKDAKKCVNDIEAIVNKMKFDLWLGDKEYSNEELYSKLHEVWELARTCDCHLWAIDKRD